MNNPFYVQPADPNSALQGFNNMLAAQDKQKMLAQQQAQKDAVLQEGASYLQGNDPVALAEWALKNPEQREHFVGAIELQDKLASRPRVETAKDALSGDPVMAYTKRLEEIRANGGDAPQLEKVLAEGEEAVRDLALKDLAMFDSKALKSYMSTQGGGVSGNLPSAVKETEWFLRQPEDVQKKHIELKRKTDPTLAEKLQYELDKTEVVGDAKNRVNEAADARKQAKSNAQGLRVYEAAISKFADAVDANAGGTISGLLPMITDDRKVLDGATKVMAPVLKDIFRASGEGTFTKDDQDMLLGMLPGPKDGPSVAAKKLDMVDTIVREKLGAPLQDEAVTDEIIIQAHPQYGDVTEADIQQTMTDTGMTREEIIARLQGG